ncbi:hypothetical protein GCK72_013837 [Caenorhabditis remanei]|uniref:Uncharacterized protein n=1 Tax=Caenorhabditis remanei TaxID=31234 RepID=A0A6A5GRS4_CAERE|nr:hypothetical protein GCK72_013837 [Caenorhabditis remanei]KAF1757381.1 hypothetical protein GCK72_013837 [Caenorhabditis remanei]
MHLKIFLVLLLAVYTSQKHLSGTNKTAEFLAKTQLELLKKATNETNLARMSKLASIDIGTLDNVKKLFRLVTILEFSVLDAAAVGKKDIYAMIESYSAEHKAHSIIHLERTNKSPSGWKIIKGQGIFVSNDVCDFTCNINSLNTSAVDKFVLNPVLALIGYDQ